MIEQTTLPVLKLRLQYERHVVHARQRARDIAELLGFDRQDQVRLATATSELARNAFRYAHGGVVEFQISVGKPQRLQIRVADEGPGIDNLQEVLDGNYQSRTGMGKGLLGTRRLLDDFEIASSSKGTSVVVGKLLPATRPYVDGEEVKGISRKLILSSGDAFEEVERQNQELLRTLAELREKQEQLARVNSELEDTNRGVVALYAELEQNASDLRRVSDLKTSFLSNLSHEFRTPLNSILALCQILSDRSDGDLSPEQEKQVGYIRRSASDLSEMVNDLLDMAKVEAGKIEIHPSPFNVEDLFAALRGMLKSLLVGNLVELTFSAAGDLPPLFSDEGKLSQILRNLISNALKYTEKGHVAVAAVLAGDSVVFSVADTGIGIAPQDQQRIFEEFVQIDHSLQSRIRGTGLGLPLSRKLAQLLGGSLEVQSKPGHGSVFSVSVPIAFGPREIIPPVLSRVKNAPTVLLIEDNLETRFIHEAALRGSHYSLQFARSLCEARSILADADVDAIVLDRMLDEQDSLPFLHELRGSGYRGPVLVVSVLEDHLSPLQAGADAFLVKPVPAGLLKETLAQLLLNSRKASVLLVDDDEINRYVLREALVPFGFRIIEARSGREAISLALSEQFAAIFLDIVMPGLNGFETLRELRANSSLGAVPIIVHTSQEISESERRFLATNGAQIFSKQELAGTEGAGKLRAVLQEAGAL